MAKNKPRKQHTVPACYLREFINPNDGLLWVFSKNGKSKEQKKPEKTFRSNNVYTIKFKGTKNYIIEETLSNIESRYAGIFREKIKKKLPLSEYEHMIFCI